LRRHPKARRTRKNLTRRANQRHIVIIATINARAEIPVAGFCLPFFAWCVEEGAETEGMGRLKHEIQ
jgi:hypothetical protein